MYDELKERCRACSQGCNYPSDCSYFNKPPLRCMRQLLSEAADAIEELSADCDMYRKGMTDEHNRAARLLWDKEHCWIPVTERLPEQGKLYLVTRFDEVTKTQFIDLLWYDAHEWWNRLYTGQYNVTHWMPLPEPPKEVETDGQ